MVSIFQAALVTAPSPKDEVQDTQIVEGILLKHTVLLLISYNAFVCLYVS